MCRLFAFLSQGSIPTGASNNQQLPWRASLEIITDNPWEQRDPCCVRPALSVPSLREMNPRVWGPGGSLQPFVLIWGGAAAKMSKEKNYSPIFGCSIFLGGLHNRPESPESHVPGKEENQTVPWVLSQGVPHFQCPHPVLSRRTEVPSEPSACSEMGQEFY